MRRIPPFLLHIALLLSSFIVSGQEMVGPVYWNPLVNTGRNNHIFPGAKKTTTALSLPFFEDFTGYSPQPDSNKWKDQEVYINNTMGVGPISRGVATFDDLNAHGIPYDSFNISGIRYADSLTSQPIDLSNDTAGDSIYFSFFYQPQGNGFYPLTNDSLMLFFKNRFGDFVLVWSAPGTRLQPFQQVMIPVTDTLDLHSNFQFRFVNKAALNWSDAIWNIDYMRMDKNRNVNDTAVTDITLTSNPSFILNDYTSMPYRQFLANTTGEITAQVTDSTRNNATTSQAINYTSIVYDQESGAILSASGPTNATIAPGTTEQINEPLSITTFPVHPSNTSVVFVNEYFLSTTSPAGPVANDTIKAFQVFDNYLAYDDGTAEKSYYLNLFPSLPGKIAIEYHLNAPDTLRGLSIYFGRQIPFAFNKLFSIYVYSALKGVNGALHDVIIDSSDLYEPGYADSVNHFWNYVFPAPLLLPAGTFYAGTVQPLGGGSDSLYFGLDVNRVGPNHAYFNVLGTWNPSLISGAIMIRPLLGHAVSGTGISDIEPQDNHWSVYPNPASDQITISTGINATATYNVTDIQGRLQLEGNMTGEKNIDIRSLPPGMYFVNIMINGIAQVPKKMIKL